MSTTATPLRLQGVSAPARPFAFLVSTTACSQNIRVKLGCANYSYTFAVKAIAPVLERLGTWQLVEQPESRLPYLAARAEAEGYQPVHVTVQPPHDCYLSPALPNVILPFWEFPEIPNRNFGLDTRQNWVRISRRADLILSPCRLTTEAFRRAGIETPIAEIPIPVAPGYASVPDWRLDQSYTKTFRHVIWTGGPFEESSPPTAPRPPFQKRALRAAKRRAVGAYRRHVGRWLSEEARGRIGGFVRGIARRPRTGGGPDLLPNEPLTLSGLVFSSIFNFSDLRKNPEDMLSAFLVAFRDRADATLVLKLNCTPEAEGNEVRAVRRLYESMRMKHDCRVVVVTDYLDHEKMCWLYGASTFYVNTSRAEGACMPLLDSLASGRPAVAPAHTAMADYFDDTMGFVVGSSPEPTPWPHDPERRLETTRHRLHWSDIRDGFLSAATLVDSEPDHYAAMCRTARERVYAYSGIDGITEKWKAALERIPGVAG